MKLSLSDLFKRGRIKRGTILYSPMLGDVVVNDLRETCGEGKQSHVLNVSFPNHGIWSYDFYDDGTFVSEGNNPQCMLFPSSRHRFWELMPILFSLEEGKYKGVPVICMEYIAEEKGYVSIEQIYDGGDVATDPDTGKKAHWSFIFPVSAPFAKDGLLIENDTYNLAMTFRKRKREFDKENSETIRKIIDGKIVKKYPYFFDTSDVLPNLYEIVKGAKMGDVFYSPIFGEVYFREVRRFLQAEPAPVEWRGRIVVSLTPNFAYLEEFDYFGRYHQGGECMLFPQWHYDWERYQKEHNKNEKEK